MQATAFTLMFLASAPIFLLPAAIALFSRRGHASMVAAANLLLWVILYFIVRAVVVDDAGSRGLLPFQPSALLVLFIWLGLLRYAIVGGASSVASDSASSNKSVEHTREE